MAPGGALYLVDQASSSVREVSPSGQEVTVADAAIFAGNNSPRSYYNLNQPQALAVDQHGDVLLADTYDNRIILVAGADCSSSCPYGLASTVRATCTTSSGIWERPGTSAMVALRSLRSSPSRRALRSIRREIC